MWGFFLGGVSEVDTIKFCNFLVRQTPYFWDVSNRKYCVIHCYVLCPSKVQWCIKWCIKSEIWHSIVFSYGSLPFQSLSFQTVFISCSQNRHRKCAISPVHMQRYIHHAQRTTWPLTGGALTYSSGCFHRSRLDWWLKTLSFPPETVQTFSSLPPPAAARSPPSFERRAGCR